MNVPLKLRFLRGIVSDKKHPPKRRSKYAMWVGAMFSKPINDPWVHNPSKATQGHPEESEGVHCQFHGRNLVNKGIGNDTP